MMQSHPDVRSCSKYHFPVPELVLLRHGQSQWNERNLFTGWVDVDLSEKGMREAAEAVRCWRGPMTSTWRSSTPRC